MNSKTVAFSSPVTVGGKEITEVTVRSHTVGDEEDALQRAISLKRGGNNVTLEICLMAKVTGLPYDVIRNMPGPEYKKLKIAQAIVDGLEPDPDENPTMNLTEKAD